MLEIHETLKSRGDWGTSCLFTDMDELMSWARLDTDPDEGDWPDGRVVCAECVLVRGDDVVGMGRILWDSHLEDSLPRVAHLCLTPSHRDAFVIETLEQALIDAYAADAIGGDLLRLSDGRGVDLSDLVRHHVQARAGLALSRMI